MSAARAVLRPAALCDVDQVAGLLREVDFKARSLEGWRWLFADNPAHRRQDPPPAMGWVLERDGALEGYLGNVHLDYVLDGQPVRAATCTSYYVSTAARADATRLMSAFFRQPGVDLFLSTTANAMSEPIYRLFKAVAPVDASFSEGLVWVADDRLALHGALAYAGFSPSLASGFAMLAAPAARVARTMTGFATAPDRDVRETVTALRVDEIDSRFDRLWSRVASAPGLRVLRDAAALRWYFSDPDAGAVPAMFAVVDGDEIAGYAVAAQHRPLAAASTQLRILDLAVRPGDERVIAALLRRLLVHARESGAGLVYCPPCGAALARELRGLRPYAKSHAFASHYLRAAERDDTARLTAAGVWHATGLDGDTPFCIEYDRA